MNFVTPYPPPEKRRRYAVGGVEERLTEAAVMLAFAFHLLEHETTGLAVEVHPDGEHAKGFDIAGFLVAAGFERVAPRGATAYAGQYQRDTQTIIVEPRSGKGDVVGEIAGRKVIAECKGGVINSTHAGQKSRLRKGLSELIGQLMVLPLDGARQVAVLPKTSETELLARRLLPRCAAAGIEIALVERDGAIAWLGPAG